MNTVGKTFTIIVFLMSLVLTTVSLMLYAVHSNRVDLRSQAMKLGETDSKLRQDVDARTKERKALDDELKRETEMAQQRLAALEQYYVTLRKEREANDATINAKELEMAQLAASVKDSHIELQALRKSADDLKKEIASATAERDDKMKKVLAQTDELHNVIAELQRVQKQNHILLEQLQDIENPSARTGLR